MGSGGARWPPGEPGRTPPDGLPPSPSRARALPSPPVPRPALAACHMLQITSGGTPSPPQPLTSPRRRSSQAATSHPLNPPPHLPRPEKLTASFPQPRGPTPPLPPTPRARHGTRRRCVSAWLATRPRARCLSLFEMANAAAWTHRRHPGRASVTGRSGGTARLPRVRGQRQSSEPRHS